MTEKKNSLQAHNFYYDITVTIKQNAYEADKWIKKIQIWLRLLTFFTLITKFLK